MNYKVLITTSGIGSRLGELTDYTNKALMRVGKKPSISYIIESYPKDMNFVITVGYYAKHIKDFIALAYPDLNVEFVEVDNYNGDGSSLVYSLLLTRDALQCPFVFNACDTLMNNETIPEPSYNWLGGFNSNDSTQYRSLNLKGTKIDRINHKGELHFDLIHIGLVGIYDYSKFFESLEYVYEQDTMNSQLSDCDVINHMIRTGTDFESFETKKWLDIGNIDDLKKARDIIPDKFELLDKTNESIFLFDDSVIKFFHNEEINANRVKRAEKLKGLVPAILDSRDNFYKYEFVKGDLFSKVVTEDTFKMFLSWSNGHLWKKLGDKSEEFYSMCHDFYFNKTVKRIKQFLKLHDLVDKVDVINGVEVPPILEMIDSIDRNILCDVDPYLFHGDFILDNIIKTKEGFSLLDWRQDFGGQIEYGDVYYDLSKLSHNLLINHDIINDGNYYIKINSDSSISCDVLVSNMLLNCRELLFKFIVDEGFDVDKVKLLTSIIWVNMSPLHEYPFDKFLFYFGKWNLFKALGNK